MNRSVNFYINHDSQPLIENINSANINQSLMRDLYFSVLQALDSFVALEEQTPNNPEDKNLDGVSNIFAFVGDRGTGKTSAMRSIASILSDSKRLNEFGEYNNLKNARFEVLDMIDPSYFDANHNILSLFIARLYKMVKETGNNDRVVSSKRSGLIHLFGEVQHHLNHLENPYDQSMDDLDQLLDMASAVELRNEIKKLVDEFFYYIGTKDAYLVMLVDDIDLDPQYGSKMGEQIRKYFSHSNIIVLLSLKMDQMEAIKRQDYVVSYKELLSERGTMSQDVIEEMVERYMAKFIPQARRFYMPDPDDYLQYELNVFSGRNTFVEKFPSVKQAIPELIFRKTRYLFYNTIDQPSFIVPRNLREINQLLKLLYASPDYVPAHPEKSHSAQLLFQKYLFENWVINNLDTSKRNGIDELLATNRVTMINHMIVKLMRSEFSEVRWSYGSDELEETLNEKSMPYNHSAGDILGLLSLCENRDPSLVNQKYMFLLRTIYSMQLDNVYAQSVLDNKRENTNGEIILNENNKSGLSDYERLVGGRFMSFELQDVLPKLSSDFPARSHRDINVDEVTRLIDECLADWKAALADGRVKLAELFMLCCFRVKKSDKSVNGNSDIPESKEFRCQIGEVYNATIGASKIAIFDLGAFFFNITRVKTCYERFLGGAEFYRRVEETRNSSHTIWGGVKHWIAENNNNKKDVRTRRSILCIRNGEVWRNFMNYLEDVPVTIEMKPIDMIRVFFDYASQYQIQLYGKDQKISYEYLSVVGSFLKEPSKELIEKFELIYPIEKPELVENITDKVS